jgi:hypothetical protein
LEGASLSIRRSIDEVFTTVVTFPLILGASINYSRGRVPCGALVPLHPQRRDVHTIAKHTIYNILLRKAMQQGIRRK